MGKLVKNRRIVSILVIVVMLLSMSLTTLADCRYNYYAPTKTWTMYFQIRSSHDYSVIGNCMIIYEEGREYPSYIILTSDITYHSSFLFGKDITLPKGTRWNFSINKKTGDIRITINLFWSPDLTWEQRQSVRVLNGKVHLKTTSHKIPFWKIDGLGCGFYFKEN